VRSKRQPDVEFDHRSTSKKIGAQLKTMRITLKLTQREVGDILGLSFQQIQKYERGSNDISLVKLIQFSDALKVDPCVFLASINGSL
jgi:transcriptional regulator with XRE-family HTH domain